jgi:hypothetical protein
MRVCMFFFWWVCTSRTTPCTVHTVTRASIATGADYSDSTGGHFLKLHLHPANSCFAGLSTTVTAADMDRLQC